MFYYDYNVAKFEKELDYNSLLNYLEKQYLKTKTETNLITTVAYSWYLYFEGDVNQRPLTYDAKLCFELWNKYTNIALNRFNQNENISLILGYILTIHGIFLVAKTDKEKLENEKLGYTLLNNTIKNTKNQNIKLLAQYFCNNKKRFKPSKEIVKALFPTDSLLDKYFNEILNF